MNLQAEITIQEILTEASAFFLRNEVIEGAEKVWSERKDEPGFTLCDAYQIAFHEIC